MDRSWSTGLTKSGPLEKGMANHFSILALKTPWTVWKRKKHIDRCKCSSVLANWPQQSSISSFEGAHHYHHPTIVWPQPCPSTENWIKDLLSMAPLIRTRPNFPHSQSLQSGSFHKPLILIHWEKTMKPQSQKTNQTDHMDHSLV